MDEAGGMNGKAPTLWEVLDEAGATGADPREALGALRARRGLAPVEGNAPVPGWSPPPREYVWSDEAACRAAERGDDVAAVEAEADDEIDDVLRGRAARGGDGRSLVDFSTAIPGKVRDWDLVYVVGPGPRPGTLWVAAGRMGRPRAVAPGREASSPVASPSAPKATRH